MKKKVVAPSNLSLVDLHLCQKNKCIIFVSYICIHIEPTNLPDGTYKLVSEAEAGPGEAQVNVARGKWGKMERGSSATFGWPWLVGRGSLEAGPRRGAAGGGSGPVRWRSGDDGSGWPGLGASWE